MAGLRTWPQPVVLALETLAVAASYYVTGRLGLLRQLDIEQAVIGPLWPPTGLAVACLVTFGVRVLPGVALGALFVIMTFTPPGPGLIIPVLGDTVTPLCAYLLLRRLGFRPDIDRLRDGLALVFVSVLTSLLISATIGVGNLLHTGRIAPGSFWPVWLSWGVSDAMGVVIFTPLLLLLRRAHQPPPGPRHWSQAVALALITTVVVWLATHRSESLLFLVFPLLAWGALTFQHAGGMLCALYASAAAAVAATDHSGPFRNLSDITVMMKLQAFNGSMALTALLLSAVIAEQRNTRYSVELACQELVEVLEHLTGPTAPDRGARERPREEEGPSL